MDWLSDVILRSWRYDVHDITFVALWRTWYYVLGATTYVILRSWRYDVRDITFLALRRTCNRMVKRHTEGDKQEHCLKPDACSYQRPPHTAWCASVLCSTVCKPLKPQWFNISTICSAFCPKIYLYVLCDSHNKERLFLQTALAGFLCNGGAVCYLWRNKTVKISSTWMWNTHLI
jgi:hypothetical protein